jgi:hypothetical protein
MMLNLFYASFLILSVGRRLLLESELCSSQNLSRRTLSGKNTTVLIVKGITYYTLLLRPPREKDVVPLVAR